MLIFCFFLLKKQQQQQQQQQQPEEEEEAARLSFHANRADILTPTSCKICWSVHVPYV